MAAKYKLIHTLYLQYCIGFFIVTWLVFIGGVTRTDAHYISDVPEISSSAEIILPGAIYPAQSVPKAVVTA